MITLVAAGVPLPGPGGLDGIAGPSKPVPEHDLDGRSPMAPLRRAPGLGPAPLRIAARARCSVVLLDLQEVWAFEAKERLCFVHSLRGRYEVDTSLGELQAELGARFLRAHRSWLANLDRVREFARDVGGSYLTVGTWADGAYATVRVPVSRECGARLRERLLAGTLGLREKRARDVPSSQAGTMTLDAGRRSTWE